MSTKGHTTPQPKLSKQAITLLNLGHLLRRAGFGAANDEVHAAARQGHRATIDQLINYDQVPDTFTQPDSSVFGQDPRRSPIEPLTRWWLGQMISTTRPLQEKMVLFWHGHFATAFYKVHNTTFMYGQNQLFRDNALGRFDDLLTGIYKDPAMLIWLDGQRNIKAQPNENFGREVMELFTLGRGNYTEDDVHANARAFTGWHIAPDGQAVFVPRLHDFGPKTLLGQTGNWGADDAVSILAAHSSTGPFLAGRLWRFFASDQPPASILHEMARAYYHSDHSIAAMVGTMLRSPQFYSAQTRTMHVKSPTDFLVTTIRQMGLTDVDLTTAPHMLALLGQELFNPPNVGGWPGGMTWINGGTMLTRFNIASQFTGDAYAPKSAIDPELVLNGMVNGITMDDVVTYLAGMLGVSLTTGTKQALLGYAGGHRLQIATLTTADLDIKTRGLIHLLMVSPEYQMA
ncbi:MAG: DUF1800 domain-containing protein [Chloroflexota bacterium]